MKKRRTFLLALAALAVRPEVSWACGGIGHVKRHFGGMFSDHDLLILFFAGGALMVAVGGVAILGTLAGSVVELGRRAYRGERPSKEGWQNPAEMGASVVEGMGLALVRGPRLMREALRSTPAPAPAPAPTPTPTPTPPPRRIYTSSVKLRRGR